KAGLAWAKAVKPSMKMRTPVRRDRTRRRMREPPGQTDECNRASFGLLARAFRGRPPRLRHPDRRLSLEGSTPVAGAPSSPSAGQTLRMTAAFLLCRKLCPGGPVPAFRANPGNAERCGAVLIFCAATPILVWHLR